MNVPLPDYRVYHQIETYIYDDVGYRFRSGQPINAHDFFCIIIWKANRAKSKEYTRLMLRRLQGERTIDDVITRVVLSLRQATNARERINILLNDFGFRFPIATAILSVFYPEDFTIYDVRVAGELGNLPDPGAVRDNNERWNRYSRYLDGVRQCCHDNNLPSLRDADRWLWGRSVCLQLNDDLERGFV